MNRCLKDSLWFYLVKKLEMITNNELLEIGKFQKTHGLQENLMLFSIRLWKAISLKEKIR